jgi:hypothetical protein
MKGIIGGIKGIGLLVIALIIFGGAIFDLVTTGGQCALVLAGAGDFDCGEFTASIGSTFITPDRNVWKGTMGIVELRGMDNETLSSLGIIADAQEDGFRRQIYYGLAGIILLVVLMIYIFLKMVPSSSFDASVTLLVILLAVGIVAGLQVGYSAFVEGQPEWPFSGVMTLANNPMVLGNVIDDSSLLPGTLETGDITEEESYSSP